MRKYSDNLLLGNHYKYFGCLAAAATDLLRVEGELQEIRIVRVDDVDVRQCLLDLPHKFVRCVGICKLQTHCLVSRMRKVYQIDID